MRTPKSFSRLVFVVSTVAAGALNAAFAAQLATAPVRIERGDPAISGAFLRPYENRWVFSIRRSGGEAVEAGVWTDRMEALSDGGRDALRRTQVAEYKKGIRTTFVTTFEKATMAPLSFDYSRSDTGETRHLEFRGNTASFRRNPGAGSDFHQDYVAKLDHAVLDFYDGTYGILLAALPLKEGFDAEIPAFDSDRACVDWVRVRVTGRETVAAGKERKAQAWVVDVETANYGRSKWWVTREAPYVIQAEMEISPGEGGATIVWRMA
jgi:hypothetical protein